MKLRNEDNDLFVSYQASGDKVIRTVSRVGGEGNVKTTFTRGEAKDDQQDLIENYSYQEVQHG